ncbi:MAG: hypothetical protein ACR2QC_05845 [Gammaproteobacteria bacterium]
MSARIKKHHSGGNRNLIRREANPSFARSRKKIPAFAGMAVLFVFADNTELGGIRKCKKTAIPAKAGISSAHPSHSCESRNLRRRIAAGNCNSRNLQLRAFGAGYSCLRRNGR